MSDNHYYGCCACIGSAGLGLVPRMAMLSSRQGFVINLFIDGSMQTITSSGNQLIFRTETTYPVSGRIKISIDMEKTEWFELLIRIPAWSVQTEVAVNGERVATENGYTKIGRSWHTGDVVELQLDMRTKVIYPVSYGHQVLMNKVVWGANYMIPTYDEEDPTAKNHIALRRGPVILAQENRLGYSVDEPVDIFIREDGYVDITFPEKKIAVYENILELEVPLTDGNRMHVTDYASAGKLWTEESKMAAWMLVKKR